MLPFEDRFTRQRQLKEVGKCGQLRLEQARVQLDAGPGSASEEELLLRAGVRVDRGVPNSEPGRSEYFKHAAFFSFPALAQEALGCDNALSRIRGILGLSDSSRGQPAGTKTT